MVIPEGAEVEAVVEKAVAVQLGGYSLGTVLARRMRWVAGRGQAPPAPAQGRQGSGFTAGRRAGRWVMLKACCAAGTAVFAGGCGAGVGLSVGALAAIPRRRSGYHSTLYLDLSWSYSDTAAILGARGRRPCVSALALSPRVGREQG